MSSVCVNPDEPRALAPAAPRFSHVIAGLSRALDVTEGYPEGHAVRTTVIALTIARMLGMSEPQISDLLFASLLKDAGSSANAARVYETFGGDDHQLKRVMRLIDWRNLRQKMSYGIAHIGRGEPGLRRITRLAHFTAAGPSSERELFTLRAARGAAIALELGLPASSADAIRSIDEHWDGGGQPDGLRGEHISIAGRIVGLAQMLEIYSHEFGHVRALDIARDRAGRWFDPQLVQTAIAIGRDAHVWTELRTVDPDVLLTQTAPEGPPLVDDGALDGVAEAFASVIDAKSPYTRGRSSRVASYAIDIARRLGLDDAACLRIRRAALLCDIGTLGVPNRILDKPDRLAPEEWNLLREHPKRTRSILSAAPVFEELAFDASCHHEKLNGQGYPGALTARELSATARIIAVADVTEALTALRPYRPARNPAEVCRILEDERRTGALCPDSVSVAMEVLSSTDSNLR